MILLVVTRGQDQSIVLNYLKVKCKSVTPTAKQINVVIYYSVDPVLEH